MGEAAAAPSVTTPFAGPRRRVAKRRRVLIEDSRRNGRYLRTTWHAEGRMFVLSTWTDEVCTGAVRIPVERAPDLINLLSDGLGDALEGPDARSDTKPPSPTTAAIQQHLNQAKTRFLRWLREPKPAK